MREIVKAVYENGNFCLLEPLKIQLVEGQVLRLTIIKVEEDGENDLHEEEKDKDWTITIQNSI